MHGPFSSPFLSTDQRVVGRRLNVGTDNDLVDLEGKKKCRRQSGSGLSTFFFFFHSIEMGHTNQNKSSYPALCVTKIWCRDQIFPVALKPVDTGNELLLAGAKEQAKPRQHS